MSCIPFEIQSEIIKRLPVKSVVQCRSVSKLWKSLIDSSKFIKSYHSCKTHLFVKYTIANDVKYISIADDDTFPNHKSSLTAPKPVSQLGYISFLNSVNSVNGLLCFYGARHHSMIENIAVLWNPSVKKAVGIPISNILRTPDGLTFIGFGVCPNTSDPKLVRINTISYPTVNWEVHVFTLTTRVWKSVSNIPPALKTRDLTSDHIFVNGFIYWCAYNDNIKLAPRIWSNMIISFDLKSDEFGEVCLPGRLMNNKFTISKVYESLGLLDYYKEGETRFCDVWIMKEGVTKSFTKMLSIKAPDTWGFHYKVLELRKNGEVIIENIVDTYSSVLEVYEPSSGRSSRLGINGRFDYFSVNSYMETLFLLDESNSIIH